MTFGLNCWVKQAGIFISSGISCIPDLLVYSRENKLKYCVSGFKTEKCIFEVDIEMVMQSLVDGFICKTDNGSLALKWNDKSMVVFSIPNDNALAEMILGISSKIIGSIFSYKKLIIFIVLLKQTTSCG